MANQLSRTDSSSNQDIRQRFNVKKTIIGVIVLLIGLCHLPEAILLIMDGISLDSILYLIGNILLCLLGIYQLKFRSREMRYLLTKSVVKEKNYSFNLKYLEPLKEMIESGNFSNNINIEKGTGGNLRLDVLMSADKKFAAVRLLQFIPYSYIPVMDMQYLRNDKIAALENLEATAEEIEAEYARLAEAYNMEADKIKAAVAADAIADDLKVKKAIDLVKEKAVVTAKAPESTEAE